MKWNWKWLATMPNTQAQILAAIILAFGTWVLMTVSVIVGHAWEPSEGWLLFILGLGGIGTVGYAAKRMTDNDYVAAKKALPGPAAEIPAAEAPPPA